LKHSRTLIVSAALAAVVAGGGVAAWRGNVPAASLRAAAPTEAAAAEPAPRAATVPADAGRPQGPLQAQAQAIVGNGAGWTIMAWSMDRKETLFAVNADSARVPASNNKVFSAAWALAVLGPDYRFPTDLLVTAPIQNGVVRGDVVIRGSGDPAFGYPEYDQDPLQSVRPMAQALKVKGVRVIEGGVIGDESINDEANYGPDWPRDTGNGVSNYAPTVSGLPFQRNMLWVTFKPDRSGVATSPETPEIPVDWRTKGGAGTATRHPDGDTVIVRGFTSRPGSRYVVGVKEAALLAPAALRQALREAGIEVRGRVATGKAPEGAKLVHRHYSITLGEMIPQLNQHSDNFFAEHVWAAAVAKATGRGTFKGGGQASAKFFHDATGADWGQVWQADGSGLSSQNRASAHALVSTLYYAHQQPWSRLFHESMAVAGDRNGTMARMFNGTPADGNLHAKTGYIRGVRSLSGYVKTAGGETVAFSFIYNGPNTSGSRGVQQNLGNLLATYTR
jgi:D-alanyl-D-alanine carboxypeptidase/D-alanyl-D-alanine-endopeptidase (penicillin-binding protein 4)